MDEWMDVAAGERSEPVALSTSSTNVTAGERSEPVGVGFACLPAGRGSAAAPARTRFNRLTDSDERR